jgi:hypothetical protein
MNLFDKITLIVQSTVPLAVTFTIVDKLPNNNYVLIAQNRMVVAKHLGDNTWSVGQTVDLFDFINDNGTICKQL